MILGFFDSYRHSGGENWKATAVSRRCVPDPYRSVGSSAPGRRTPPVCRQSEISDERETGVRQNVSQFGNDFSNATRCSKSRARGLPHQRVPTSRYPSHIRESRSGSSVRGQLEQWH